MTKADLSIMYKKETGNRPMIDNGLRQDHISDNYRYYQEYVQWLEEKIIGLINNQDNVTAIRKQELQKDTILFVQSGRINSSSSHN